MEAMATWALVSKFVGMRNESGGGGKIEDEDGIWAKNGPGRV